jgi:hypothetical protein
MLVFCPTVFRLQKEPVLAAVTSEQNVLKWI